MMTLAPFRRAETALASPAPPPPTITTSALSLIGDLSAAGSGLLNSSPCAPGLFQTLFHSAEKRETGNSGAADFVEFGCLMIFDFGRKLFNRNFTDTRAL